MRPPGQRQPAPRRAGGQVEELGPLHPAHRQRSPSKTSARLSSSVPEPFLVGNQLRSTGLSGLPRAADLIRVVVGVGRVDLDPRLHAVGAALGVRPTPRPMLLVEPVEDLGRRLPRRGDSLDRCLDRALGMERCPGSGGEPRGKQAQRYGSPPHWNVSRASGSPAGPKGPAIVSPAKPRPESCRKQPRLPQLASMSPERPCRLTL
jgi:hypothetical protein